VPSVSVTGEVSRSRRLCAHYRAHTLQYRAGPADAAGRELDAESTITHKEAFDQIDAWARTRTGVTIAERYLDWDQTGSKMDRPELDRMLADLEAGRIDGVVVAQVDRLSRAEVGDALATVAQIAGVGDDPTTTRRGGRSCCSTSASTRARSSASSV
jgi:hypothetical protein